MKTCIITGASGYIGSHLTEYLVNKGWNVNVILRPSSSLTLLDNVKDRIGVYRFDGDTESLSGYMRRIKADVVFHVAATIRYSQIEDVIRGNVEFGTQILESMVNSDTRLIVSTGSYWQNQDGSADYHPVDLYASTKEAFEKILQYYVEVKCIRAITLRLFDVYGEDDKRPKLLNLLCDIAGTTKSIDVSPGEQMMDMVHVSDVCSAYLSAFELLLSDNTITNDIFGVFTNNRVPLKQMISMLGNTLGKKINVNFGAKPYKQMEVMNPTKSYKVLPNWHVNVSLDEGLELIKLNRGGGKSCRYLLAA